MRACDIMSTPVVVVRPETPVKEAAALLAAKGFTALPVVGSGESLLGIVTEADVVRDRIPRDPRARAHPGAELVTTTTTTVGEVMATQVTAMGPGTDVAVLARTMLDAHQRSTPIVDGALLVGIVTRRDIVRVIARDDHVIADDVRHRLETYDGDRRWLVEVSDGMVSIGDRFDDPTDRHVATVLAEAVPGVVRATAYAVRDEEVR